VVVGGVVVGGVVVVPPVPSVAGGGVIVTGGVVGGGVVVGGVVSGGVAVAGGVVSGGVAVVGGAVVSAPVLPPAPAVGAPPVPGAVAPDEGAPEPEAPPVDDVGVVVLPVEPPVAALFDLLELPAEPPVATVLCGSTVAPEPPSSCVPPDPAPEAQPIVRDAASGSAARKRERTLLCFDFERDMSSGTGHDRTSDVWAVRAPRAQQNLRRADAETRRRSEQLAELRDLIVGALQPDLHALLFDARERLG
jgi:hypothetical protein